MTYPIIATTFKGLEQILADELYQLGAGDIRVANRAVSFAGDDALLYAGNIYLRTALRILKPVLQFDFNDLQDYYDAIFAFPWERYFGADQTFAIDFTVHSPQFTNTRFAALKMKDAIVDRFRHVGNNRPSIDVKSPQIQLNLHIVNRHVQIALDSSGEPLFKRGYRSSKHAAPLNEVLAAGMILMSGWDRRSGFFDPMCGSGTLPVEAALIAYNIAPGLIRKNYAFKNWPGFNRALYRQLLMEANTKIHNAKVFIDGSDIDKTYIAAARENAMRALVDDKINFFVKPFEICDPPPSSALIIMNPPYGQRIGVDAIAEFYRNIGNTFKSKYTGKTVWLLTYSADAVKSIGLKPSEKIQLFNGPLECRFLRFDMYSGSKKMKYNR